MVAVGEPGDGEEADHPHVEAGGDDTAHDPGEEVLEVAVEHVAARRLARGRGHEDGQALDPTALVEEAEPGAGDAGGQGIDHGAVHGRPGGDLIKTRVQVLDGLVGAQVVDEAAQSLQAVDVDTHTPDLGGLGAEALADVGGGDDLRHRHRRLVPVESDGGRGLRHGGLHAVGACA